MLLSATYSFLLSCWYLLSVLLSVPVLEAETETSHTGHFKLSWQSPAVSSEEYIDFEVQRSLSADFQNAETIYLGSDRETFLSGLENGSYYFRVRTVGGSGPSQWSEDVVVTVEHYSLSLAYTLFIIGGIVFISTAVMVVKGASKSNFIASE